MLSEYYGGAAARGEGARAWRSPARHGHKLSCMKVKLFWCLR